MGLYGTRDGLVKVICDGICRVFDSGGSGSSDSKIFGAEFQKSSAQTGGAGRANVAGRST